MRLGLIQGFCDVAITASEIQPDYALCDGPPKVERALTYDYGYGDYALSEPPFGTSDISAANAIACLEYGMPYITSGFALMSLITTKPFDISSSVFNNDMLNAFSVIVLISMTCGYLASILERKNMHLGTVSRGAYWSIMNYLQNSENEPVRKKGRTLMIIMMFANMRAPPQHRCVVVVTCSSHACPFHFVSRSWHASDRCNHGRKADNDRSHGCESRATV